MVECQLPKLDVAGSIPVSRSIPFFGFVLNFKIHHSLSAAVRIFLSKKSAEAV